MTPAPHGLRPYQHERVLVGLDCLAARRNFELVMATATGKTRTALSICSELLDRVGGAVLWLCDRRSLIGQTKKAAARAAHRYGG